MGIRGYSIFVFLLIFWSCNGQHSAGNPDREVGGPCEGCEALHEYGDKELTPTDTLPDYGLYGTPLKVTGTVFHKDGKTPASNIVVFIYHTNPDGIYPTKGNEKGWAKRQGYLRGWVKTGPSGEYTFYTHRPGNYPSNNTPAHIHIVIKEPGLEAYYLDDFEFTDDPFVQPEDNSKPRGGSGLITLDIEDELLIARRDIILGLNIPGHEQ